MNRLFNALLDALTNRPWKRVVSFLAVLYLLWVVLPWALDAPPMNITSSGAPFVEE